MKTIWNILTFLSLPFAVLNFFGGIVSGIWLAILGNWGTIALGFIAMIISGFLLTLILMPYMFIAAPSIYFAKKGTMFLSYIFSLLGTAYIVAVMTIWCGGILLFFVNRATDKSLIPVLIWSYGVALGPWQWMAQKDAQAGSGQASTIITIFAQLGYVLTILMVIFRGIFSLIPFLMAMSLGLILNDIINIHTREAPSDYSFEDL